MGGNIIPMLVRNGCAQAYDFTLNKVPGATERGCGCDARDVGRLDLYFEAHMDLCAVESIFNLYNDRWPILTNVPSLPPAKFVHEAGRPGRPRHYRLVGSHRRRPGARPAGIDRRPWWHTASRRRGPAVHPRAAGNDRLAHRCS